MRMFVSFSLSPNPGIQRRVERKHRNSVECYEIEHLFALIVCHARTNVWSHTWCVIISALKDATHTQTYQCLEGYLHVMFSPSPSTSLLAVAIGFVSQNFNAALDIAQQNACIILLVIES